MDNIVIKQMTNEDIPAWISLSNEYDDYVRELVTDLTQWYEGNETDMAFIDYMNSKIEKQEAFMSVDRNTSKCLVAIAFSKKHNRITFFGISHYAKDYYLVGKMLMSYALDQLISNKQITITILKSKSQIFEQERKLIKEFGFIYIGDELENGVPVDKMMKQVINKA